MKLIFIVIQLQLALQIKGISRGYSIALLLYRREGAARADATLYVNLIQSQTTHTARLFAPSIPWVPIFSMFLIHGKRMTNNSYLPLSRPLR